MIILDYTGELFDDITNHFTDYYQTGFTVCGAQDPSVWYLGNGFYEKHPELKEYSIVRVIDKYLNEWSSATLLEFSNNDLTDEEEKLYEDIIKEEESYGKR